MRARITVDHYTCLS